MFKWFKKEDHEQLAIDSIHGVCDILEYELKRNDTRLFCRMRILDLLNNIKMKYPNKHNGAKIRLQRILDQGDAIERHT